MTLNVSLIQLNGKVNSTKNAVVSILTDVWPLSAKEVYSNCEKKFELNVSYQAIHKTIKQLEDEEIIVKEGSKYKLNEIWIEKAKEFSEQLSENYKQKINGETNFTLPSIYETDKFLLNLIMNDLQNTKDKPFVGLHWCHFWVPLFLSVKEYRQIKELATRVNLYALGRGNTKIDKWCAAFWSKQPVHHKIGVDCAAIADLVIYKDMVIEVFYPTELKKELDLFYEKAKNIKDLNITYMFEKIFLKPTKINIAIHHNKELAAQLKEQTLNYFE